MMNHPTWESLVDHAEGRGEPEEAQALAAHVASCAECSQDVEWLRQAMGALRADAFVAPPREARLAVLAAFETRSPTPRAVPPPTPKRGYWAPVVRWGLAALAAMLLVVVFWRGQLGAPVAIVGDAVGTVTVQRSGQPDRPAIPYAPIAPGDFITTGLQSTVTLTLLNGNATVTLSEHSNLGIASRPAPNELALETDTAGRVTITVQEPAQVSLTIPYGTLTSQGGTFSVYYLYGDKNHGIEVQSIAGQVQIISNRQESLALTEGQCLVFYRELDPVPCPEDAPPEREPGMPYRPETELSEPGAGEESEDADEEEVGEESEPEDEGDVAEDAEEPGEALEERYFGIITRMPPNRIGEWMVGGRTFVSTGETLLREDKAPFAPGSCVQVRFLPPATVTEFRTEDADKCD